MARDAGTVAHTPVMLAEVLTALNLRTDGMYLDATFGRGGHAQAILGELGAAGRLLCLDRDPSAVASAQAKFLGDPRASVFHAHFSGLDECVSRAQQDLKLNGIFFDLGVSSPQLDDAQRGFSFMQDGPLDMRMNLDRGTTAAEVVNGATESELVRIFFEFGEERFAKRIARAIVADRDKQPFERTLQLSQLIARVAPTRERSKHPATRVFQALRIYVNRELDELEMGLAAALRRLAIGGRLVVISFHSLEDRIVKRFFRLHGSTDPVYAGLPDIPPHARPTLKLVGKSILPTQLEIDRNPRARSARLRVAERLDQGYAA